MSVAETISNKKLDTIFSKEFPRTAVFNGLLPGNLFFRKGPFLDRDTMIVKSSLRFIQNNLKEKIHGLSKQGHKKSVKDLMKWRGAGWTKWEGKLAPHHFKYLKWRVSFSQKVYQGLKFV